MTRTRTLLAALALGGLPLAAAAQGYLPRTQPARGPLPGEAPAITSPGWQPIAGPQSALDRAGHATADADGWTPIAPACGPDPCGPDDGPFACGTTSVQYLAGGFASSTLGAQVPSFEYLLTAVRFGWVATPVEDRWIGRGAYEWVLDLSAAAVTTGGYGDYFVGPTVYLRYNWVEPGSPLVPYQQLGFGVVYTDAYKDRTQEAIGQQWEFSTRWDVGVRYFVSPNMSLDAEFGFQHLSNAGLAERNLGVNSFGLMFGMTYFFPAGR